MREDAVPATIGAAPDAVSSESLEAALAESEAAADRALAAAAQLTRTLRQLRIAAQVGNLRDMRAAQAALASVVDAAHEQANQGAASWTLDEEAYLADGRYRQKLLAAGERATSTSVRQYVRRWINEWDLLRLYPMYQPSTVAEEPVFDYDEDADIERADPDSDESAS